MQELFDHIEQKPKRNVSQVGVVCSLLVLGLVVGYFYVFPPFPRTFVRAIITIDDWRDYARIASGTVIDLNDEKSLSELSYLLPGAGRRRFSMMAGGWTTGVTIELHDADGEIVEVHISNDLADFSDRYGGGDGSVRAGFDRFLLAKLEKVQP
ncbi:MAG: hypothetical protein WEB58_05380 [Planctomycetaceae bacterium]